MKEKTLPLAQNWRHRPESYFINLSSLSLLACFFLLFYIRAQYIISRSPTQTLEKESPFNFWTQTQKSTFFYKPESPSVTFQFKLHHTCNEKTAYLGISSGSHQNSRQKASISRGIGLHKRASLPTKLFQRGGIHARALASCQESDTESVFIV